MLRSNFLFNSILIERNRLFISFAALFFVSFVTYHNNSAVFIEGKSITPNILDIFSYLLEPPTHIITLGIFLFFSGNVGLSHHFVYRFNHRLSYALFLLKQSFLQIIIFITCVIAVTLISTMILSPRLSLSLSQGYMNAVKLPDSMHHIALYHLVHFLCLLLGWFLLLTISKFVLLIFDLWFRKNGVWFGAFLLMFIYISDRTFSFSLLINQAIPKSFLFVPYFHLFINIFYLISITAVLYFIFISLVDRYEFLGR
ncbi:hypothetical protein JOD45_001703 [Scopulibacillus daqui]|uniref:ABC-2 family transporter n=1 Tax=Scopulibacillus daqui TaxID=1469162 RepID=A0ABS2PZM1_9BACL|nr:hypothetical protein [Scopulibacillus daqui]